MFQSVSHGDVKAEKRRVCRVEDPCRILLMAFLGVCKCLELRLEAWLFLPLEKAEQGENPWTIPQMKVVLLLRLQKLNRLRITVIYHRVMDLQSV